MHSAVYAGNANVRFRPKADIRRPGAWFYEWMRDIDQIGITLVMLYPALKLMPGMALSVEIRKGNGT